MFRLRASSAVRAARGAALSSFAATQKPSLASSTMASRLSKYTAINGLARFSTRGAIRNSERPLEPLEETEQPGTAPSPTLESEELLRKAREEQAAQDPADAAASPAPAENGKRTARDIALERRRSLFIGNPAYEVTDEQIQQDFSEFGEIESFFRPAKRNWIIVVYKKVDAMLDAVANTNGTYWHGRRVFVMPRQSDDERQQNRPSQNSRGPRVPTPPAANLFVGNIPFESTSEELTAIFNGLDGVRGIRIAVDRETAKLKGYAHVEFDDETKATAALEELKTMQLGDRFLRVDYSRPRQRRENRRNDRDGSDEEASH